MNNWSKLHGIYKTQDWIRLPSLFAEQVIPYFPKTGTILELGAGHGQDSFYFAELGYDATSTDLEIDSVSANLAERKDLKTKVRIKKVDLRQPLAFDNERFDIVYAHLSLHYFDQSTTESIFNEIYRVLKPGGILAFLTNSVTDPEYASGEQIDKDYFDIEGVAKRYLSVETAKQFANRFSPIITDDNGETYKDAAKGIHHLIRFIGKKS